MGDVAGQASSSGEVAAQQRKIVNRLKRARGQLSAVIEGIESGKGCVDVVTQLAAVNTAIERAGFLILSCAMQRALASSSGSGEHLGDGEQPEALAAPEAPASRHFLEGEQLSQAQLEKLFMML